MNDTNSLSHANITPLLKKLNQFHQMIQMELNEMNLWTYVIRQDTAGLLYLLFAPKCRTKDTGKNPRTGCNRNKTQAEIYSDRLA